VSGFRLFQSLTERDENVPVGTVKVRGHYRVQKQRDGSWLRVGDARPGEGPPKTRKAALTLPGKIKRSPPVKQVPIAPGHEWRDTAPDMPGSTMDTMFIDKDKEPPPSGPPEQAPPPQQDTGEAQEAEDDDSDDSASEPEEPDEEDDRPKPKPQRKALHEWIGRTFLNHVSEVNDDRIPVAVLFIGGPVSGRSTALKSLSHDATFVHIDPGLIATMIPEYAEAIGKRARDAQSIVQEEAYFVAHDLIEKAVLDRKNIAIETVGADSEACSTILQDLEGAGYHTIVVLMDTERQAALDRNKFRGKRIGQWAPKEAFPLAKEAIKTYEEVRDDASEYLRVDTSGDKPKYVTETLSDLAELFTEDKPDGPDRPAMATKEIRKRILESLKAGKIKLESLPEKYKPGEGVILVHYDDTHIGRLNLDESTGPEDTETA
jgi:adenylate kinase family enzyme